MQKIPRETPTTLLSSACPNVNIFIIAIKMIQEIGQLVWSSFSYNLGVFHTWQQTAWPQMLLTFKVTFLYLSQFICRQLAFFFLGSRILYFSCKNLNTSRPISINKRGATENSRPEISKPRNRDMKLAWDTKKGGMKTADLRWVGLFTLFSSHDCSCPLAPRKSFDILALYKSDHYYYYLIKQLH